MKLLILTQKVDKQDSNLGFFHSWIENFANVFEHVTVICLEKGAYDLPENVSVISLGKEIGVGKFGYTIRFFKYIWQYRKNYQVVFVHMNPEYVVLGAWLWHVLRKPVSLWYTHKSVDLKLKWAEKMTDVIFTASEKSFRLSSDKVIVAGHGVDTDKFTPQLNTYTQKDAPVLVHVGRITKSKNIIRLLQAIIILRDTYPTIILRLHGLPLTSEDKVYEKELRRYVREQAIDQHVVFTGLVPYNEMPQVYIQASVAVNVGRTGGLDKVILEAMAAGVPVVTTNDGVQGALGDVEEMLYVQDKDFEKQIETMLTITDTERRALRERLHAIVAQEHNIKALAQRVEKALQK